MRETSYLRWLANETPTTWWHDSGDPDELAVGLDHGATGVTTNPVLAYTALNSNPEKWASCLSCASKESSPQGRTESLVRGVVQNAAKMFLPTYEQTAGRLGYVCAQVNPALAGDRPSMIEMARRFHAWGPNIAVKLPVTAAGLDVLEDCVAEGITITATVSFTVPQVLAVAERHRRGSERARKAGLSPGRCFAVIMIGRLDDYLREVAHDRKVDMSESDIQQAGIAVTKRAYSLFQERGYEATLVVAALRGTYHMTTLTGAELIMSIHPKYQAMLLQPDVPRDPQCIDAPMDSAVVERLAAIPEFVRAYEPHGMDPQEFISYGLTQRTLSQFLAAGWSRLETLRI